MANQHGTVAGSEKQIINRELNWKRRMVKGAYALMCMAEFVSDKDMRELERIHNRTLDNIERIRRSYND